MSTKLKKCLSVFLVVVTLLTSAPFYNTDLFDLFSVEAEAVSLSDYNATAAAQWAREHCNDIDSVILGKGYWTDGGDCANFVSQCLYMGGIDMSKDWNTNGYFCHWYEYNSSFNGSFIRAQQLYNYLTNGLGATSIRAPQASQMSVGDVIIYSADGAGRMTHCAIVVKADSTGVEIAYHSVLSNGVYKREITPAWQLQFSNSRTYLIKMNGKLCDENNPYAQKFDVYTTGNGGQKLYANSSRTGSVLTTYLSNEYTHVFRTETVNGVAMGYTFRYGKWGWVQLNKLNYQRTVSSANTSHTFGPWITVDKGTCTTNGIDQRTCTRCGKVENRTIVGSHVTDPKATCTQPGTCKLCGVVTEGALGHNMVTNRTYTLAEVNSGAYGITLTKAPTCTENGTGTIKCSRCIYTETVAISATGHNWQFSITNPSCVQPGAAVYKCSNCASEKSGYENPNSTISDWTDKVINGLTPKATKTQYRYKTKSTTTSYETSLSGWTQNGGSWQYASSGSVDYLPSWPSGYDKNHSLYHTYNHTPPTNSETTTNKTEVSSAQVIGYIYWHYCRNNQALGLNYNRQIEEFWTSEFTAFHTYFSTTNHTTSSDSGKSVNAGNSSVCKDSYWYYKMPVYRVSYTNYRKLFNYYKWSGWSGWQDASVSANSDRQVETRTVYKYDLAAMGHNFNVEDSNNYKAPTCTEPGYIGTKCSRCGVMSDKTKTIPALGHNMGSWYNYGSYTSGSTTITVYRRDCQRTGCTYYELKQNEKTYVPGNIVAATCSTDGYTEYKNTSNASDIFKFDFVTALGHKADENWVVTKAATCFSEGEEQCKCVRHDNGKTCNKIFSRPIELIPHTPEKVDAVPENCLEDGIIEHYKCKICDKLFADQKCNTQLSEEDIIVKHEGHNEGIWKEIQALKHDETGKQAGMYELHCTREHIDENGNKYICDALLDEYTVNPPECVFELAERVDPECNALGYEIHRCPLCKDEYTIWIDMLPHPWGETETIYLSPKDPEICYSKQTTCTHCGIINEDTYEEFTHNLETVTLEGECVSGSKEVCKICDYEVPAKDPAGHTWSQWEVTIAPTCDTEGEEQRHCTVCSKTDPNTLSATGHDYVETEKVGATCTESGYIVMICQNDNSHTYKKITDDPLGHDLCDWYTVKEATCAEKGLERCDCQREYCDFSATRDTAVKPDAHDWDDGVIAPDSTCKDHGTKTYICQNDASHTYTEEVALDENNHAGDTYIKDAKEPDCTNDGYTGDTYCADCDKKLEDGEVIPATGHVWGDWVTTKEPTYTEMGEEKRVCSKGDAEDTRPLPVLTRPSDENENIETEKTVEYDSATGEAVIKLVASSKGEKITVNSRTPLDIVLVLDQSGSMEGDLLAKLKTATDDFTKAIYQDAVENGIDHRIAMVGFAMQNQYNFGSEYPQYLNTEILTTGGAPVQYNSLSTSKMNEVYKNALVSVNVDGTLNPVLTLAKDNLQAKGATAADLGLDMACQIFAQNENDGSRKRIVVFMTDGVPTYKSDYMEETATNATTKANLLKDAYDADLYSVGVLSGSNTNKAKTFLNSIASKDENNKALYFDCADAEKLVEDFQTIATQSTTVTTDFADITLIDTVSDAFTLTAVQENELRKNAIEKLGITNDDITITRYADGTTEVKLEHINPVAVADGDDVNYVIDIDFRVTANEKALIAGSYGTNTDNAGVLIGTSDVYENNFAIPGATVENAEGVIYFTVNGITYHVVRIHKGDTPESPEFTLDGEYTFSGWDIPDEVVFDGGKLTVDATLTQKEYTVTWNTADGTMTDSYYAGDIIIVPEVGLNANGEEFIGWNTAVPVTMTAENLEFTAIYGKHEHSYTEKVLKKVSCGVEGKVQFICSCGDSYTETVEELTHKWATSATSSDGTETAYSHVYCENCGESPNKTLEYTIKGTSGRKQVSYDLKLTDAENITIQPDGDITISLPVPQDMKNARNITIYREEADGTLTNLNGTVKNGYITFTTTHFSIYIIEAEYECAETGNHADENTDNICDICGDNLKAGEPEKPSGNCSHMCHKSGFMNFLWKIARFFYKLFGMDAKRICSCGAAHW